MNLLSKSFLGLVIAAPAFAVGPPTFSPADLQAAAANTPSPTTPGTTGVQNTFNSAPIVPGGAAVTGGVSGVPQTPAPAAGITNSTGAGQTLPGYGATSAMGSGAGSTSGTASATNTGTSISPGTVNSTGAPTGMPGTR
jgi:hypothetical protein